VNKLVASFVEIHSLGTEIFLQAKC